MFKVIIAGTRTFNDYDLLCSYADYMLSQVKEPIEIVSGHAQGADLLGEKYAQEKGYILYSRQIGINTARPQAPGATYRWQSMPML